MKKNRFTILLIAGLVLLAAAAAVLHLTSRTAVGENSLLIEFGGSLTEISLGDLSLEPVRGSVVNGKGETLPIDGQGAALSDILTKASASGFHSVTVVSDDEYKAEVTADEILESGSVYLLVPEEGRPQLVVFGDSNSKRNVKNVARLILS